MNLAIPDPPFKILAGSLSRFDDSLGRLDERLRCSPVAAGLRARLDLAEALALALAEGDLIDAHDFALHDAQMDARSPTHELVRAHHLFLTGRRRAGTGDPLEHLGRPGLRRLAGLPGVLGGLSGEGDAEPPSKSPGRPSGLRAEINALLALASDLAGEGEVLDPLPSEMADPRGTIGSCSLLGPTAGDEASASGTEADETEVGFREWQKLRRDEAEQLPPPLAAIFLAESWLALLPLPQHAWLASLIAPLTLTAHGRSKHVLLPGEIGLRLARRSRKKTEGFWQDGIAALEAAVHDTLARHDRLLLARERVEKLCAKKRGHSHLRRAAEIALQRPLITLKSIAEECQITERAALGLVRELAPLLTEVSGRQRYRAWMLS